MDNELTEFIQLIVPNNRLKDVTIYRGTPDRPYLYHVSNNPKIKHFEPMVSTRTINTEDRAVPRICTAPSLWGCIIGQSSFSNSFFDLAYSKSWLGGYVIYGLPFEMALSPSVRLVPDVEHTDEKWIVGYNGIHKRIPPIDLGRVFIISVLTRKGGAKHQNRYDYTLALHLRHGMWVTADTYLQPGYYRLLVVDCQHDIYWDPTKLTIETIDAKTYHAAKQLTASMLSLPVLPASFKW
jgi:hypothetical protein